MSNRRKGLGAQQAKLLLDMELTGGVGLGRDHATRQRLAALEERGPVRIVHPWAETNRAGIKVPRYRLTGDGAAFARARYREIERGMQEENPGVEFPGFERRREIARERGAGPRP